MSILFKGNLEEGNYTLIKSTDGWVLKGKTSYVGFNFADRPQGELVRCKDCKHKVVTEDGEYEPEDIVCEYWMSDGLNSNDYCSYGERKE